MLEGLKTFTQNEDGAISVDWIVLCAGVVCLGCLAVMTARDATFGLADTILSTPDRTTVTTSDP